MDAEIFTRRFYDNRFSVRLTIEEILCVYWKNLDLDRRELSILWLKVKENDFWLRFFLDAGTFFGSSHHVSEFGKTWQEDTEDKSDLVYEYGRKYELVGNKIVSASIQPTYGQEGIKLSFILKKSKSLNAWADYFDREANISVGDL